jgi:AsmA-like C-terminal region
MIKKTLKITGIALISLIAIAFATPLLFKNQITNLVKNQINKSLNAKVDFKEVSLSIFRHFPKMSISITDFYIVGKDVFSYDTLLSVKTLDASANLISVIKGKNIKVYGIFLESPRIHALVNKNGKANWDVFNEASSNTEANDNSASAFQMNLKKYKITNGYLQYRDETTGMTTEIVDFDHEGKGDFTQDMFMLSTKTEAQNANFVYASIPYLKNVRVSIDADIQIDNKTNKYTFQTNDILLNNLRLSSKGFFQIANDSVYAMDIGFNSPSNDFKDILSLVPAIYQKDFDKIKAGGRAVFNGFVRGTYSPKEMPAYTVNLDVKDGFFQNPDLPKQLKNIQLALTLDNPDGVTDHSVVTIPSGHFELDNEPFDFRFLLKNPETIRFIDAAIKGKLDLSKISKLVKLEEGTKLSGFIWADAFARGNLSAIENHSGPFAAGGFLDIQNLFYSSKSFPQPIRNGNMKVEIENTDGIADKTFVNITAGHVEVGEDPVDFSLAVRNPVSTFDFAGNAKGRFTLDNVKQFVKLEPGTSVSGIMNADLSFSGYKSAIQKSEYDRINTTGTVDFRNIKYVSKDYPTGINITKTAITLNQKNIVLTSISGNYLNTNFNANGVLNNLIGYAMENQTLSGTLDLTADKMNLNQWLDTDTTSSGASSGPFLVPANVNFIINAKAGHVKYDKVDYKNISGTLTVNDETVNLKDVRTEALDGAIDFNGSYSTKANKKEPDVALDYDVRDIDVQKAFYSFNTVQKLMPIGQFLAGKLSSQLSMTGKLDGEMMPDFNSLTGNGNLLLLQGILKKFAPLEKLASTLQIDELKQVSIKDIKNYIEFANGKVLVKPFLVKVKDIEMLIGGTHGFNQSLDYVIQMKLPRKYLGAQGNALINNLVTQASNKGVPINVGDIVNLDIKMGGSLADPTIKTDLKNVASDASDELKQQAVDFAKAKVDSTKLAVKDSVKVVKQQVVSNLKEDAKKQLFGSKDSTVTKPSIAETKKSAESTIKNTLGGFLKKKKIQGDALKAGN